MLLKQLEDYMVSMPLERLAIGSWVCGVVVEVYAVSCAWTESVYTDRQEADTAARNFGVKVEVRTAVRANSGTWPFGDFYLVPLGPVLKSAADYLRVGEKSALIDEGATEG